MNNIFITLLLVGYASDLIFFAVCRRCTPSRFVVVMRPQTMQAFLLPASYGDSFNEPSHRLRDEPFSFVAFAIFAFR
jgi:hypothetical protein